MAPVAVGPGGDGVQKLEYLSLVSKVCSELETHIGVGDKVLAEFITELGRDSATAAEFDARLKEKGADFPDYFVRALLTITHAILPLSSAYPSSAAVAVGPAGAEASKFPGLARLDDPDHARNLRLDLEQDADAAAPATARDDRDRRHGGRGRDRDYDRGGHHHDRDRGGHDHDRGRDQDWDRGRDRDGDRHQNRDKGRDKDMDRERSRRYEDEEEDRGVGGRRREVAASNPSNEPELYQVYRGRVTRMMDTGRGGREGLVHVSPMASRRVANAKEWSSVTRRCM
jgi:ATP-dependent RNA helicase DHX8/PRP22